MGHTKGPWDWNDNLYDSNDIIEILHDKDENGEHPIADVLELGGYDQTLDNAQLIAAAPDLLEASTDALLTISDTLRHEDLSLGGISALEMCVDDLRNAIAKAKGGEGK